MSDTTNIVVNVENTLSSVIAPYVKSAADGTAKALGVTDVVTVGLIEAAFTNIIQAALATAAEKLGVLLAPKAK